jgi:hypothetical protein
MALLLVPSPIFRPSVAETSNRIGTIGSAGTKDFGSGALIPSDISFDPLYNPIHIPSGSFM